MILDSLSFNILLIALGYLLGSIPFGFIITKYFKGIDIRSVGSGNIGATNATRALGKKLGALVFFLDFAKSFIIVCTSSLLDFSESIVCMLAFFTVLGHIFPIWLNFKGGKGVATYVGALLGIDPILGLIGILVWVMIFIATKTSSIASLSMISSIAVVTLFYDSISIKLLGISLAIIIALRHTSNIKRLINKTESKI